MLKNRDMLACSNIGIAIAIALSLYAELWQPMVAKVSLFQVAEVLTNLYDYTIPMLNPKKCLSYLQFSVEFL